MNYIKLPFIYNKIEFLNSFYIFSKKYNNYLKIPLSVTGAHGNYQYTFFNGGVNNNYGKSFIYSDYVQINQKLELPLEINCSNLFIDEKDYCNVQLNQILQIHDNGSNSLLLSSIPFWNYLKEKYPNYYFNFSFLADFLHPISVDIINQLTEHFNEVELPLTFQEDDFSLIKQKNKIIIPIGNKVCKDCKKLKECYIFENKTQIDFSNISSIHLCKKNEKISQLNYIEEIKYYNQFGFNKFKIINNYNPNFNKNYDYLLLKEFFKDEIINTLESELINNVC